MADYFGVRMWKRILIGTGLALPVLAAAHSSSPGEEVEATFLSAAEEALEEGESVKAEELYRASLQNAENPEDRLRLIGPWARTALVAGKLVEQKVQWEDREKPVLAASVFQYLGDLGAARQVLEVAGLERFGAELVAWSEELGDLEPALEALKQHYRKDPTEETHAAYLHALLKTGDRAKLAEHLEEQGERLREEVGFWRVQLAAFARHDVLPVVEERLGESWEVGSDRPEVLYALAELRVFQGRVDEAVELFWQVFALPEEEEERGIQYFQRLNYAFHDRYGVKHRLGDATGRYGNAMCMQFTFLGLREDPRTNNTAQVRAAALLYLQELEVPRKGSPAFLVRVEEVLDQQERAPSQRMFAYAMLGAPRALVREVEGFVEGPEKDNVAAEFSLLALNRFVLSTDKFRDLRERMLAVTREIPAKMGEDASVEVRMNVDRMQAQILRRLGEKETVAPPTPGSPEAWLENILSAIREGKPAEAEQMYREAEKEKAGGPAFERTLLHLAQGWSEARDSTQAAERIVEYLEHLYPERKEDELVSFPVEWNAEASFPPANDILSFETMEQLYNLFSLASRPEIWEPLKTVFADRRAKLPAVKQPAGCLMELMYLWWAEEHEAAREAAEAWAKISSNPNIRFLQAHVLGRLRNFDRAREALAGLEAQFPAVGKMEFAFAVAEEDPANAKSRLPILEELNLTPGERLQVASGLAAVGLPGEGERWVANISSGQLNSEQEEQLQQLRLQAVEAGDDKEKAKATAGRVLLADLPMSFPELLSPTRRTALSILESHGELENYQKGFAALLALAPQAVTIYLLQGELEEYRWVYQKQPEAQEEALRWYQKVLALRPGQVGLQLDFAEWAVDRGLDNVAVDEFNRILPVEAQEALLDSYLLFGTYRRAGRLPELVTFLEKWKVPEAESIDEFYGLQPTEHLFRPLAQALWEDGDHGFAERAWRKGLEINPPAFTEEIRLRLVEFYLAQDRIEAAIDVMKPYLASRNPDPEFYAMHPFVETGPRWLRARLSSTQLDRAPVERFLQMMERAGGEEQLRSAADGWEQEFPEQFSAAVFAIFLRAREGDEGWRTEAANLSSRFPPEGGMIAMLAAADELWKSLESSETDEP